ncbi:hypothetical protein ERJ75_000456100 [Trypanosoma vivax]|nr:hypothetical protein ERJ75_000456100 [Trypanosoma vivax]
MWREDTVAAKVGGAAVEKATDRLLLPEGHDLVAQSTASGREGHAAVGLCARKNTIGDRKTQTGTLAKRTDASNGKSRERKAARRPYLGGKGHGDEGPLLADAGFVQRGVPTMKSRNDPSSDTKTQEGSG